MQSELKQLHLDNAALHDAVMQAEKVFKAMQAELLELHTKYDMDKELFQKHKQENAALRKKIVRIL